MRWYAAKSEKGPETSIRATLTRQRNATPLAGTRIASWVMPPPFFQGVAVKADCRMICMHENHTDVSDSALRADPACVRGQPDWREQIDIGAERPALARTSDSPAWARLQGPNQWPAALPELRTVILRWQDAALGVLTRLLRAVALVLGQAADSLEPLYRDEPHHLVKLIRYPGRDVTDADQGVGAHKDSELLTLLLQDEHRGLQVQTERGWIEVPPQAGTFVVNLGEQLELASDGYLRATMHRVITPPAGAERLSVAFFLGARLDATVPLLSLPPALAARARGPERDPHNPLIREVGRNYLKGRLRSHPDVAQRHHADLLEGLHGNQ